MALTAIILAFALAACGGGGGGGGMGSFGGSDGTASGGAGGKGSKHYYNGGEVGKWPNNGGGTGGGFGGNGAPLGGVDEIYINGNTSLDVTEYTFNGATYSDVKSLVKAVLDNGTNSDIFYVNFTVNSESSPRTARIRANSAANPGDDLTIDYQYKATYTIASAAGTSASTQEAFYYKRDGLNINLPVLSDSNYEEPDGDGIAYHANKWNVQGQTVSGGNVRINASGDVAIGNITPAVDRTYGFKSSGELVVNSTGTVAVNNSGRSTSITKIELPASGSVALDLSSVTNVALTGTLSGSTATPCVTNPQTLVSISLPESSFSIGTCAFVDCSNITGVIDLSHCTSLGDQAFRKCSKITNVILGSNITSIPGYAFIYCTNLRTPIDLSHCTSIGRSAFKFCSNLTSINLPNCTEISPGAFQGCTKLASINIPSCTSIGYDTFWDDSELTSVDLSSCTTIDQNAFNNCTKLANVTLGNSLTTIGVGTFYNVPSVAIFTFAKDPTSFTYSNYVNTTDGVNYSTFKNGVTATWSGNTYTWNESANSGNGAWQ